VVGYKLLSWAGVRLDVQGKSLVIDAIESVGSFRTPMGEPKQPLCEIGLEGEIDYALITHLHPDHFDPAALKLRLRPHGRLICHSAIADAVNKNGLQVQTIEEWAPADLGPFSVTAVPAVDGFGAHQVSWVVTVGEHKAIHCGDTLFHGYWWDFARRIGPVDLAFLPINGVVVDYFYETSGLPAALTGEQAAVAARLMKAKLVVPIHYREFHNPPTYTSNLNAEAALITSGQREGVPVRIARSGEQVGWQA
jgi:L-ascorbate metabolism protein UlaG (beta-lactamase superfamily)